MVIVVDTVGIAAGSGASGRIVYMIVCKVFVIECCCTLAASAWFVVSCFAFRRDANMREVDLRKQMPNGRDKSDANHVSAIQPLSRIRGHTIPIQTNQYRQFILIILLSCAAFSFLSI